jgi:hypothetical protein
MTTNTNPAATTDPRAAAALRAEIFEQAAAIADMRGVSTQTALCDVYGGPPSVRAYGGPVDECPDSALASVLDTAVYLTAALSCGVSWAAAWQTLGAARRFAPIRR